MLDLRTVRDNPEAVRNALTRRHQTDLLGEVDRLLELDLRWRETTVRRDALRNEQNTVSKEIGRLKREKQDATDVIARMQQVAQEVRELDDELRDARAQMDSILLMLPNIPHESVPEGKSEDDNVIVKHWGDRPEFDFEPKAHWDLGADLGILDIERGGKISGRGFAVYKGQGAKLQRALISFMLDIHTTEHGYTEIWPPALVNRQSMIGTGQIPKFEDDMYRLDQGAGDDADEEERDLFLIPTAEVPVTNLHAEEILDADELPIYYAAYTPCFRREAGAAGRDTRGIQRVHQFDKVEMVKFTSAETSYDEHESLLANAEAIIQRLGVPYRVSLMCAGDLDFKGAKQYDVEIWAAGQERWLEVSSVSNFIEFQARRANIRYRPEADARPEFVHTLNGSGVALPRLVISLLENNQEADGTVHVPEALRPYFGSDRIA
ncbi:serine--tRNA ligase [Candidatus Poribacteria bacterium]|mgnify:CR=1 FL=1|jgi:seryl-tRNA synthetase|nr:serine--tRNA ligase [Candidatus Poribacteria bacterium]MBT5536322.1 serine--tRNA ligase [Candidatus Poribacteria bacterium]MBT5713913.1 serine--tRNA ligase [Candidatus Poribacteria bacterium]MBT7095749.1 serine--tRNA ligase [Candidatus Poribacteria bacterium]MBT7808729.1 serine--tRNA ligase [Candidatus Poribacteria bacterium]